MPAIEKVANSSKKARGKYYYYDTVIPWFLPQGKSCLHVLQNFVTRLTNYSRHIASILIMATCKVQDL